MLDSFDGPAVRVALALMEGGGTHTHTVTHTASVQRPRGWGGGVGRGWGAPGGNALLFLGRHVLGAARRGVGVAHGTCPCDAWPGVALSPPTPVSCVHGAVCHAVICQELMKVRIVVRTRTYS